MNRIRKLQERRGNLVREARALLDTAHADNERALTADEATKYDAIEADIRKVDAEIAREQRLLELEARAAAPQNSPSEERALQRFSLVRAINQVVEGRALDGVERELHDEGLRELRASGVAPSGGGIILPRRLLDRRNAPGRERRDVTATGGSGGDQGGVMVQTSIGEFIEALYDRMVVRQLGARFLNLTGNLSLPRMATAAAATHKGETAAADESSPTFDGVSLTPKRLTTFIEHSRQILLQTDLSVDQLLLADLQMALAVGMERGIVNGSGSSNQPTGILNTSGIGSIAGGTNGAAPTWANIVGLETEVSIDNADVGSLAYLTNAKVRGKLKTTSKAGSEALFVWGEDNRLNGYRAEVTNVVPSNLTKGTASEVCSAILFGNFADLVVAQWGGVAIMPNPYIKDTEGLIRITAEVFYDAAVRRPQSFAAMKDALTT